MQAPTRTHLTTITLQLQAATATDAHGVAQSAAEHLLETFNDDGSIQGYTLAPNDGSITLAFALPDQACYDLMCTASEGGISYWADIVGKTPRLREVEGRDDIVALDIISFEADIQDGPVQCDHPEIACAEIGRFMIDPGMIRDGMRRLLAPGAQVSPAIRNDAVLQLVDPEHGADADTADAVIQFAVFGEIVFG